MGCDLAILSSSLSVTLSLLCAGIVDYQDLNDTLIFEPGSNGVCTQIMIVDDQVSEPMECFFVTTTPELGDRNIGHQAEPNTTTVCIEDDGRSLISYVMNRTHIIHCM